MKIEARRVSKRYGATQALASVDLSIRPGKVIALLGVNGAGKTTLLRALAGVVGLDQGEILFDGQFFRRDNLELRRQFLFLPDFPPVFEHFTPLQHLGMVLRLYRVDPTGLPEKVVELLRELDLLPVADAPFYTLSRGQRYKASLAGLLAVDPDLWLLDEPFASGMDPNAISHFKRHAHEAAARGKTVIYSTQILDAAERFSDCLCVIHAGEMRAFGNTSELLRHDGSGAQGLEAIFQKLTERVSE